MELKPREPVIEVSGDALAATIDGFGAFREIAMKHHTILGILKPDASQQPAIDRFSWYPQGALIAAFAALLEEVGSTVLFDIGRRLPDNLKLPPFVVDIHSSVSSVDISYHMNHRINGLLMFNEVTGKMLEGIGHYGNVAVAGERKIISVCDTPYPCELDLGVLTSMTSRFEARARVVHDESQPCRRTGGASCTYVITW